MNGIGNLYHKIHVMKTKSLLRLSFFMLFLFGRNLYAQNVIVLEHAAGSSEVFQTLPDAYHQAQNGDIIYLPGGTFSLGSDTIKKGISIIGAGHHADSALVTGVTYINSDITIGAGAHQFLLEGVYIAGNIWHAQASANFQRADNIMIRRCNFASLKSNGNNYTQGVNDSLFSHNWQFVHNIIRGTLELGFLKDFNFSGNFVNGQILSAYRGGSMTNNIFFFHSQSDAIMAQVRYVNFSNNVFRHDWTIATGPYACYAPPCGTWGNTFLNNIFEGGSVYLTADLYSQASGNLFNINFSSLFVSHAGGGYSYNDNYHFVSGSAGTAAGTDGTDLGVYGSNYPYRDGAVPFNPHIYYKNISPASNAAGQLQIHVKVRAQDH
jgi:hypothetical protein